jgi:hypothetical protein
MISKKLRELTGRYYPKPKEPKEEKRIETKKMKFFREYLVRHDIFSGRTMYDIRIYNFVSLNKVPEDKFRDGFMTIVLYDIPVEDAFAVPKETLYHIKKIARTYFDIRIRQVHWQIILKTYDPHLFFKRQKNLLQRVLSAFKFLT